MVASRAMATFDAVFVGARHQLAGRRRAARTGRAGTSACSSANGPRSAAASARRGRLAPGFTHELMASWHPLFTGSAAYAELKDELDRRGVEYLNTDLPTGYRVPDGSACSSGRRWRRTSPSSTATRRATAPRGSASSTEFMANADLSFGVLGTELWSAARARSRPARRCDASGAAACSSSRARARRAAATG